MSKIKNFTSFVLCFSLIFTVTFTAKPFVPKAYAVWGVTDASIDPTVLATSIKNLLGQAKDYIIQAAKLAWSKAETAAKIALNSKVTAAKILALLAVQEATALIVGEEGGLIIRDWNQYLNVAPKQKALDQMVAWYNTASQNRNSSMNYEGVAGNGLDSYFMWQAKKVIKGNPMATTITEYVADPKKDLFSTGNMKGIMLYAQCGNNPACFALTAADQYEEYVVQNTTMAEREQMNGFLPKKIDGRIFKPASLINSALMQVDAVGTNLIMTAEADNAESYYQIMKGAAIAITARAVNYGISDDEGKANIANQAKSFPFSLSYSSKTRSMRVSK